jgi:putative hemolysin
VELKKRSPSKRWKTIGMFPAGEVSTYKDGKLMVDKPWEEGAIKVIRKAQVPVVPIFSCKKTVGYFIYSKIRALSGRQNSFEVFSQKDA